MSVDDGAETGFAKINLALHVRRRRNDGYHDIETLFAFCEDGDGLSVAAADDLSLTIGGPFGEGLSAGPDNLVLRAAAALRAAAGIAAGAALRLDKRLPIASGIGGGSADAAAALRLLARFWGVDGVPLHPIAAQLGADVPACLVSRACRGDGRGDALAMLDEGALAGMPVLLVNPLVAVSTGPVFAGWDRVDRGALGEGDPIAVALAGRNDLEAPARTIAPVIADVVAALQRCEGVTIARMSGSGATCFALFEDISARDAADAAIAAARPDWWRLATLLR